MGIEQVLDMKKIPRRIELGSECALLLVDGFLGEAEADRAFAALRREIRFEQKTIRLFGREVLQPRLSAWHGDPNAVYTYSGATNHPLAWTPALRELRGRVEATSGAAFNAVLVNFYRDGADAMGMHSDDEAELGPAPLVASVSLGARRRFVLRHRKQKSDRVTVELGHGSLLVMLPPTQRWYKHGVPREARAGERLNLTFRHVGLAPGAER